MARNKWEQLLPPSTAGNSSARELLGQLASVTGSGAQAVAGSTIGGALAQSGSADVTEQLSSLASQIINLSSAQQAQIGALQENTQAVGQNTASRGGSASSASALANTVESAATSFLGGGLSSLSPLIGGILSLFGGGGGQTLDVAPPFLLPPPLQSQAGVTGAAPGQIVPVSYGETGPRSPATAAASQVTIQVNAMDSQSFLDHSDEIAMAVKQALLNSSSLNDVIASLSA